MRSNECQDIIKQLRELCYLKLDGASLNSQPPAIEPSFRITHAFEGYVLSR